MFLRAGDLRQFPLRPYSPWQFPLHPYIGAKKSLERVTQIAPRDRIRRGLFRQAGGSGYTRRLVIRDQGRADENSFRVSRSRQEVLQDFEKLIEEKKLFGADRDPAIRDGAAFDRALVKKKGKGTRFLIRKVPSRAKLLRYWTRLFEDAIAPYALFDVLSARIHEFEHRENRLLFGKGRVIYDTEIFQREESVGELTLSFASLRDPALGVLAYLSGARLRVVYIEHIRLTVQKSGYASALFRHYERLFHDLRFNQFRLSASLAVGGYYWAQEGFDFSEKSEAGRRKADLRALVKERGLPVGEIEIGPLNHAYDFARFRRELRIPIYRDAEGFYSLKADTRFCEEVALPLGKAFLLCSAPWEGYKTIYTGPRREDKIQGSSSGRRPD